MILSLVLLALMQGGGVMASNPPDVKHCHTLKLADGKDCTVCPTFTTCPQKLIDLWVEGSTVGIKPGTGPSNGGGAGDCGGQAFPTKEHCNLTTICSEGACVAACVSAKPSKPEPMDVPAIKVGEHIGSSCEGAAGRNVALACMSATVSDYSCADKRRVLLTAENGDKHCVLFQP